MNKEKQIKSVREKKEKLKSSKPFQKAVDALDGLWTPKPKPPKHVTQPLPSGWEPYAGRPARRTIDKGSVKRQAPPNAPASAHPRPVWVSPGKSVKDLWTPHQRKPKDELLPERGILRRRKGLDLSQQVAR